MIVNGGTLFTKQLKKEGVEQIFSICGGQIMPLIYGCRAEGIAVIDVRHENGAEQDFGTFNIVKRNTLWSARVYDAKRIPEYVSKAFIEAMDAVPEPIYIECLINVMKGKVEVDEVEFPLLTRRDAQAFGDL